MTSEIHNQYPNQEADAQMTVHMISIISKLKAVAPTSSLLKVQFVFDLWI